MRSSGEATSGGPLDAWPAEFVAMRTRTGAAAHIVNIGLDLWVGGRPAFDNDRGGRRRSLCRLVPVRNLDVIVTGDDVPVCKLCAKQIADETRWMRALERANRHPSHLAQALQSAARTGAGAADFERRWSEMDGA
jgi:hypothetical protein